VPRLSNISYYRQNGKGHGAVPTLEAGKNDNELSREVVEKSTYGNQTIRSLQSETS
jgi:hypothetical protein